MMDQPSKSEKKKSAQVKSISPLNDYLCCKSLQIDNHTHISGWSAKDFFFSSHSNNLISRHVMVSDGV